MWVDREQPFTRTSLTLSSLLFFSSFSILSLWWPTSGNFQPETSLIFKRQPDSLTTTSASLRYHLPRVYQLDIRTGYEPRQRGAHVTSGSSGRRSWGSKSGCGLPYNCEENSCIKSSTGETARKLRVQQQRTKWEQQRVKTRLSKTDHLPLLR